MRDIYVKATTAKDGHAVRTDIMAPGHHADLNAFVYRIKDVPETVGEHLAVFTFNSCSVLGHTVEWRQLHKGQVIRGEGPILIIVVNEKLLRQGW